MTHYNISRSQIALRLQYSIISLAKYDFRG